MSVFSIVENVNIPIGPIHIDLRTKKARKNTGILILILGLALIFFDSWSVLNLLPWLKELLGLIGVILFLSGAILTGSNY